jgi:catechol 2,3-dioxygenase-like lactoylglutathione lyase family enzyme
MSFRALKVIPILRIFSIEKAREFYFDYLGFHLDWEHRFDERAPLYMQVSRAGLVLHLSEHYGDGSPGTSFQVNFEGVHEFHAELSAKNYGYWRPGITETWWGTPQLRLTDPFGNKICLCEPKPEDQAVETGG